MKPLLSIGWRALLAVIVVLGATLIVPRADFARMPAPGGGPPAIISGTPPIPDATNRPVFNAGTGVLTWQGPSGGGPSNGSYVSQTQTLTNSGAITTTSTGQIIEHLNISASGGLGSGLITVAHNNVIIRQNHLLESTTDQGDKYTIFINQGVTGTVIEDNEIDGHALNGPGGTSCVAGQQAAGPGANGVTMRRNNCHRSEQAIRFILNNVSFTENWCHEIGGVDADWVESYPVGGTNDHLTIRFNSFDGTDNVGQGSNSAVNMSTGAGLTVGNEGPNIVIDTNWFLRWGNQGGNLYGAPFPIHVINNDTASPPTGGHLQFQFTNNGYFDSSAFGTPGGASNTAPGGLITPNSGNFIMSTPTSTSGPLINGTGAL